ncbi:MAG: phosphoglucomutase/phosphomannomutase family protein [Acidobacteriota bacterium]
MGIDLIRFGTSGWRAVISEQFTFENVRKVARAIGQVTREISSGPLSGLALGHDTRFLSQEFAAEAARVLVADGVPVHLAPDFLPTPVLAFSIRHHHLNGGINITASHNPPEYNGIKFSTSGGAPAPRDVTDRIEALVAEASGAAPGQRQGAPDRLVPMDAYFSQLEQLVETAPIRAAGMRVMVDSRFGTSRGWLDRFLRAQGVEVVAIHDRCDPLFGGGTPDCSGGNLQELQAGVLKGSFHLGLATDGDADRFGIVDAAGEIVSPNLVLALLVDYLARRRGWREGVGRTVATTHLIDDVAREYGFPVHETPVGFKHFNGLLASEQIFMGAEESAGMSIKGHVPEKDGILANLLVVEMLAVEGPHLDRLITNLFRRTGPRVSRRRDIRFDPSLRKELLARTADPPSRLAGVPVASVVTLDGVKWIREDGAWLLIRVSGTEPVVRIYAEAENEAAIRGLLEVGSGMVP